jgi:hypothetical protein
MGGGATVFSWLVKRPVEMVGVRSVKAKWPVYIELVGLPNATKSIKENRITISGTDFNAVHPEFKKKTSKTGVLWRVILGN